MWVGEYVCVLKGFHFEHLISPQEVGKLSIELAKKKKEKAAPSMKIAL